MSGLSGATVHVSHGVAIKRNPESPERVVLQGEWLARQNNFGPTGHLPLVSAILETGYAMEALQEVPTPQVELDRMVDALQESVWRWAPDTFVDTAQTLLKADRILLQYAPELIAPMIQQLSFIRKTEDCLTHGDPTAENVMLRNGHQYVIIDPIPSTDAVPDDMAVDVGKLLQSAHGWEDMKGEERASFTPNDVARYFEPEVFEVGQLWCIMHFIRTLPYTQGEVHERVLDKLHELLGL